jgi:hypothetical protein
MAENVKPSSPAMILFAWLLVGLPLGWGVYNTLLSSQKLFRGTQPQTTVPASSTK